MATNVGTVFVTVRASTRGMASDIRRQLIEELSRAGRQSGEGFRRNFRTSLRGLNGDLEGAFGRSLLNTARRAGGRVGEEAGRGVGQGLEDSTSNIVNRTRGSFHRFGRTLGLFFGRGFGDGVRGQVRLSVGPFSFPLGEFRTALLRVFATLVAVGNAIVGLTAEILALVGALSSAVSASAAFLPILSAIGQGVSVLAIGFQGMSDAITKGGEDLEKLGPAARSVAVAVRGLSGQWEQLTLSVQANLFAGVADSIRELGSTLFPVFESALSDTASILNELFDQFARAATSANNVRDLSTALDSQNRIIELLGQAAASFAAAFRDFFITLLPFAERLADAIRRGAVRLAELAEEGRRSGDLAAFFERAFENAGFLLSGIRDVTVGLVNMFDVGEDRGTVLLEKFAELGASFRDFATSTEGHDEFREFFEFGAQVTERLQALFEALAPAISSVVGVFSQYLGALEPLIPVLGQVSEIISGLVDNILGPLVAVFGEVVTAISEALQPVLEALRPLFEKLGETVRNLFEAVQPLVEWLGVLLKDAIDANLPVLEFLIDVLVGVLESVDDLIAGVENFVDFLKGDFLDSLAGAQEGVGGFGGGLGVLSETLANLYVKLSDSDVSFGDFVRAVFTGTQESDKFEGGIRNAIDRGLAALYTKLDGAGTPFSKFTSAVDGAKGFLGNLRETIRNRTLGALSSLYLKLSAAGGPFGLLVEAAGLAADALHGTSDAAGGISDSIGAAIDAIRRFNNTPIKQVGSLVPRGGIGKGFASGGIISVPTRLPLAGEAGPEAVVPLDRPLSQVDPSVRALSAIAQGLGSPGGGVGLSVEAGAIVVNAPAANPHRVAEAVLDRLTLQVA